MCLLWRGVARASPGTVVSIGCLTSLMLTGCATSQAEREEAEAATAVVSHVVVYHKPLPPDHHPAAIEDDGLPSQSPPLRVRRPQPDDPTEPFSPNYGRPDRVRLRRIGLAGQLTGPATPWHGVVSGQMAKRDGSS